MPVTPTYPGVYIEEAPPGPPAITGVGTSITAFVGFTKRGPSNKAITLFNYGDYEREFGGLAPDSPVSYAVRQFFMNGGTEAIVVRVAQGSRPARVNLRNGTGTGTRVVLEVTAASDGDWGNLLKLDVDWDAASETDQFNLTVTEYAERAGEIEVASQERFTNLSMNQFSPNYAVATVNAGSSLIRLTRPTTALDAVADESTVFGSSLSGALSGDGATERAALGTQNRRRLAVAVDGDDPVEIELFASGGSVPASLSDLATVIQTLVRQRKPAVASTFSADAIPVPSSATANNRLRLRSAHSATGDNEEASVRVVPASRDDAAPLLKLGTANGGREQDAAAAMRPAPNGTLGADLTELELALSTATTLTDNGAVKVDVRGVTSPPSQQTITLWSTGSDKPTTLAGIRQRLQERLNASSIQELREARVDLVDRRLVVVAGGARPDAWLELTNNSTSDTTTTQLGLAGADRGNVQRYSPGVGATSQAQGMPSTASGSNGTTPGANEFKGTESAKSGMYALADADLFNILAMPGMDAFPASTANAVWSEAISWCDRKRAFLLIDPPRDVDTRPEAQAWIAAAGSLRHKNAAAYWPRIMAPDPLQDYRLSTYPASGAIAGIFARTDGSRGVWKAPAGSEARLRGVEALSVLMTDDENGTLNPQALNALRTFPTTGPVVWGARTLEGNQASPWRYVPVRRLALFIEESLYRGTQWCVFEPNHEPLWAQIRANVGAFMHNLYRQQAFRGSSPREAYLVKCDGETTTENDIELGIVNIVVGFLPPKPAEFVILKITQLAGQVQA